LRPIALACVYTCANAVDLPIVGMGGVATGAEALDLVAAGASAVALGTILFSDPLAASRVRAELTGAAVASGYESAAEVRGKALESAVLGGPSTS
jgi:dihydroorotate dehydrogenase (NAD+) catalytic subunit